MKLFFILKRRSFFDREMSATPKKGYVAKTISTNSFESVPYVMWGLLTEALQCGTKSHKFVLRTVIIKALHIQEKNLNHVHSRNEVECKFQKQWTFLWEDVKLANVNFMTIITSGSRIPRTWDRGSVQQCLMHKLCSFLIDFVLFSLQSFFHPTPAQAKVHSAKRKTCR